MQTFNIGDPVTCIVYGDGRIVDFDSITNSPLKMWIYFGFQPDSIPYTLDGRLHPNANITLRHKSDLQSFAKCETEKAIRHNQGKSTWSLVDFATMEDMVAVLDFGAKKYSPDNWKKGLYTKSVFDSIMRHLAAYISGEDNDQESGLPHTGHIMCNAMFLAYTHKFMPSFDNRDKKQNK